MKIRVKDYSSPLTTDIAEEAGFPAAKTDALSNRCINSATDSLKRPCDLLSDHQRMHLQQVLFSMRHVHRAIRELLRSDGKDPMAVSAMPVVRAQLETLFAICLVVEQPGALSLYLKDGWKKQYVRHLWMREETRNLPRVVDGLQKAMTHLDNFRPISNVTEAESQTIEMEEIGTPMPAGIEPEHIRPFPTPLGVIKATTDPNRKAMLARLYPEYQFLCGFVHFSPGTQILSSILDQRHPAAPMFSSVQREDIFQKEIAGPALWISLLSIVQSCTEFVSVYSDDVELARNLIESWNPLLEMSLLARVVWQIRSKRLLGVLL